MADEVAPRPGSYASLERRIETIENRMATAESDSAEMKTSIALIQAEQKHQGELFAAQFRAIEAHGESTSRGLAAIETLIQNALRDPETVMSRAQIEERRQWLAWREKIDASINDQIADNNYNRGKWFIVGLILGSIPAIVAATAAVINAIHR